MHKEELTEKFYEILENRRESGARFKDFTRLIKSKIPGHMFGDNCVLERSLIEREHIAWSLFSHLYNIECMFDSEREREGPTSLPVQLYSCIVTSRPLLSLLCVLDWLEKIKQVSPPTVRQAAFDDTLQRAKTSGNFPTRLDPDVVFDRNAQIEQSDKENDKFMMKEVFYMVRKGKLAAAQDLCIQCGQFWKAIILGGLLPRIDLSRFEKPDNLPLPSFMKTRDLREAKDGSTIGNSNIELSLQACWNLSEKLKNDKKYEKALFGSMCGNYEAMSIVCRENMYDHFWSMIRSLFIIKLREKFKNIDSEFEFYEVTESFPTPLHTRGPNSLESILRELQSSYMKECRCPFVSLQLASIGRGVIGRWDEVYSCILSFYEKIKTMPDPLERDYSLRFVAHLSILLRHSLSIKPEQVNYHQEIVHNYILYLLENQKSIKMIDCYLKFMSDRALIVNILKIIFLNYHPSDLEKCIDTLINLIPDYYPILCNLLISSLGNEYLLLENSLQLLSSIEEKDKMFDRTKNIIDVIIRRTEDRYSENLLELVRNLILLGMNLSAEYILSQYHCSIEELTYWQAYIQACKSYTKFRQSLSVRVRPQLENMETKELIDFPNNPLLISESQNENIRYTGLEALEQLKIVIGFGAHRLPLGDSSDPMIVYFNSQIVWACFDWTIEIFKTMRMYSDLRELETGLSEYHQLEDRHRDIRSRISNALGSL